MRGSSAIRFQGHRTVHNFHHKLLPNNCSTRKIIGSINKTSILENVLCHHLERKSGGAISRNIKEPPSVHKSYETLIT